MVDVSAYGREIGRYQAAELAIVSSVASSCDPPLDPERVFLISSWSEIDQITTVSVFLNSRVATSLRAASEAGATEDTPCCEVGITKVTYNKQCNVEFATLASNDSLKVNRQRRPGVPLPTVSLSIDVSGR